MALSRAPNTVRLVASTAAASGNNPPFTNVVWRFHALSEATRLTGLDENEVTAVVELYVLRVMLFRGASPRRILGVEEGLSEAKFGGIWATLWGGFTLIRAGNTWRVAFSRRVLEAWRQMDMGTEAYESRPPFAQRRHSRKPLFVLPWISPPPEQTLWQRILDWRRRVRPWRSV